MRIIRIAFGRNRQNRQNRLEAADFFGHIIEGDAVGTGDVLFVGVVLPRRKDEHSAGVHGIKEVRRGLVVLSEAVIGEVDDVVSLAEKIVKDVAFVGVDEGRDHDGALSCCKDTAVLIVAQTLIVAVFGLVHHGMPHMNRHVSVLIE